MEQMNNQKVNFKYVITVFGVVVITWLIHEFAHWLVYTLQGYDAYMGLNKAGVRGDNGPNVDQQIIGAAAGPLITLLQAILVFVYLKRKGWNKYIYPFLFIPFYMRFLAGLMNFIMPNDEGFISQQLGLGLFTISILISAVLFWMVYKASKKYQLKPKFHILTILFVMFFSSLVIMVDQFFRVLIIS